MGMATGAATKANRRGCLRNMFGQKPMMAKNMLIKSNPAPTFVMDSPNFCFNSFQLSFNLFDPSPSKTDIG